MEKHFMLDLETLGITPNAVILEIGAVEMDLDKLAVVGSFSRYLSASHQAKTIGRSADFETLVWWAKQPAQLREVVMGGITPLGDALTALRAWICERVAGDFTQAVVWCNGASFDFPILANAYGWMGATPPWKYWNERDYRTLKALFPHVARPAVATSHDALDDANRQAEHLLRIFGAMRAANGSPIQPTA